MSEHEKFKEIIDLIWYKCDWWVDSISAFTKWIKSEEVWLDDTEYEIEYVDIRKIIFLPCFKNTFSKYLKTIKPEETIYNSEYNKITEHLSDPVWFLYNLIK